MGWDVGNTILCAFTRFLEEEFLDALHFRIYGDDFVLLSIHHLPIAKEYLMREFERRIEFEVVHIDITTYKDREEVIHKLEEAAG